MILISQNTPKCTRSASDLYDFTTLRRDIMKERALEVQQERERHAKDVEVDDDEEQKKAKAATEDDEIRRQLLQQLTDREQQQQKKKSFGIGNPKKKCVSCGTEKTCRWRRSKLQLRATLCDKCYRNEALALTSRQCYVCKSRKTTGQWFKSKVDRTFDLCRNCWVKEHATLANKMCVSCKSTRATSQWLKSKILEGADLCNNCYQKEVYQLSKFVSSGTTTNLEELVNPLLPVGKGGDEGEEEEEEEEEGII